ncbi:acyl carrier protein [Cyanothece sp. BG0011]|uniref:acyl carrier protein n=1 Tax=Cyanothece sp. BG0011 TaxID=2082950 RepID=UPI001E5F643E|nr:acyl carrier protein [Cyanothece sp. BG0011]
MIDDQAYTLNIIKKVITSYLDKNIPNNETGLNMLVNQCDDLVYKIASKIYTESGHKVEFYIIRDVINCRIETLQEHIAKIKEKEATRLAKQAQREQEEDIKQLEVKAKKLESEIQTRKEEETKISEQTSQYEKAISDERKLLSEFRKRQEAIRLAEEAKRLENKTSQEEFKVLKRNFREENKQKIIYDLFLEVKNIISKQLEVDVDEISLESNLYHDLGVEVNELHYIEIIMALEEHFDIEIPDEIGEKLEPYRMNKRSDRSTSRL